MINHLCSDWSKIFRKDSGAKYWKWARLLVHPGRYPDQAHDLLGSRIICLVPEIKIRKADHHLMKLFLESVRDGGTFKLKKLTIMGSLANIDPGLLSSVVLKLKDCNIDDAKPGQAEAILAGISNSTSTSLKQLVLCSPGSLRVRLAPNIVAEAAMKLETLKARFSSRQWEAIITRLVADQDSRLRKLESYAAVDFDMSSLDPEVLAGALVKLETVGWDLSINLSPGQLTALLSRICQAPVLKLKELVLHDKNLSLVPPEVLAGAIQKLERVEFLYGRMTAEQATAIRPGTLVSWNPY